MAHTVPIPLSQCESAHLIVGEAVGTPNPEEVEPLDGRSGVTAGLREVAARLHLRPRAGAAHASYLPASGPGASLENGVTGIGRL
jgi:hypothetical protein